MDSGLLAANSMELMERMLRDIQGSFDIQDMGDLMQLLGIKIIRNHNIGMIHISQLSFINTIYK